MWYICMSYSVLSNIFPHIFVAHLYTICIYIFSYFESYFFKYIFLIKMSRHLHLIWY